MAARRPFVIMCSRAHLKWKELVADWNWTCRESGSSQTGFVPIWEFVAVHAFIMKCNEARKCSLGHGENTAPPMFPWQIWHEREPNFNHQVSSIKHCSCKKQLPCGYKQSFPGMWLKCRLYNKLNDCVCFFGFFSWQGATASEDISCSQFLSWY